MAYSMWITCFFAALISTHVYALDTSMVRDGAHCLLEFESGEWQDKAKFKKYIVDDNPEGSTEGRHIEFFYSHGNVLKFIEVTYYGETGRTKYIFNLVKDGTYTALVEMYVYSNPIDTKEGIGNISLTYEKKYEVCDNNLATSISNERDKRNWQYVEEDYKQLVLLGTQNRHTIAK